MLHNAFTLHRPTLPCSPWLYNYCIFHTFTPLNATTLCQCFTNTVQSIIAQLRNLTTLHSTLPLLCNSLLYHYFTEHSYTLPSHYFTRLDFSRRNLTWPDFTITRLFPNLALQLLYYTPPRHYNTVQYYALLHRTITLLYDTLYYQCNTHNFSLLHLTVLYDTNTLLHLTALCDTCTLQLMALPYLYTT